MERFPQLRHGSHRPQRVVLVDDGNPEDSHHRVADELLDRSPVVLENAADLDEVAREHPPVALRVERLAERRRVDHVREDDGHRLAHLARRSSLLQGGAACEAEPCVIRVGLATPGASGHVLVKYGEKRAASTLACCVRCAFRPPPGGAARRPRPGQARRGRDLPRHARNPPRAARGRRQFQGREGLRRAGARAGARRRRDEEPHARAGGRAHRPRGADDAHGQWRLEARVRQPSSDGDPARGPPGLGQDDDRREARAPPAQGGPLARARRRRPRAPGSRRAARAAGPRAPDPGLHGARSRSRR